MTISIAHFTTDNLVYICHLGRLGGLVLVKLIQICHGIANEFSFYQVSKIRLWQLVSRKGKLDFTFAELYPPDSVGLGLTYFLLLLLPSAAFANPT